MRLLDRLALALRLMRRELVAGELSVLLAALVVAVAAMSSGVSLPTG